MFKFLEKFFDSNEKQLQQIQPIVDQINGLSEKLSKLSDEELRSKTDEFRKKIGVDLENCRKDFTDLNKVELEEKLKVEREKLEEVLPEVFAVAKEASSRVAQHKHYDVQVMAGYVLFENKISELFTGEGKTLAANLPLYLYALTGRGAHLVTVNDYLARRDAEWNGHILNSLGIRVSAINSGKQYRFVTDDEAIDLKGDEAKKLIEERNVMAKEMGRLKYDHMSGVNLVECSKKEAYDCDIVYGTNSEFGFDYLRDNMVRDLRERVQGPKHFVIVDEADSILIDEARTPLIISTSASASNEMYKSFSSLAKTLQPEKHYIVDEKANAVSLTDPGIDFVEKQLGVDNVYENAQMAYHLDNALKAKELYKLDDKYMIRNGEIVIVDAFTGRALAGRRYSEGLHQAIEAKEGVEVKKESRTMATITLQNFFRLYSFLSGMTATALTEAEEFSTIYSLDTIVVPTNRDVVRKDEMDVVYRSMMEKFKAIIEDIKEHHAKGQPVLVGTTSVEKSEILSHMLGKEGVKHSVLNAKQHAHEAKIISIAGQKDAVTIATNMAGRGTDIALGKGVKELGGLYVIGSERHESRRIDNQLRGRSGRQGDPGESKFYVSFEDDLMRKFGGDKMQAVMTQVGMEENVPISMGILGKTIENAQKRVESSHYDDRKRLVEYDDVLNQQRDIVYTLRASILSDKGLPGKKKIDKDFDLLSMRINQVQDDLDTFLLSDESTWDVSILQKIEYEFSPLEVWILKKELEYIDYLFASQKEDDMKIDNVEERKLYIQIKNLISEIVFEKTVKSLGYENSIGFFRKLENMEEIVLRQEEIKKVVFLAFVEHIQNIGSQESKALCKMLTIQSIDRFWMEHLDTMADLREGISLRQLSQKDPLVEYKNEGFQLFDQMLTGMDDSIVTRFFKVRLVKKENIPQQKKNTNEDIRQGKTSKQKTIKKNRKVGRNDPCPCGSGKKYKKCCYPKYD